MTTTPNSSHFCFNASYNLNRNVALTEKLQYNFTLVCMVKNQIEKKTAHEYTVDVKKRDSFVISPVSLTCKLCFFLCIRYIWAFCLLGFNTIDAYEGRELK